MRALAFATGAVLSTAALYSGVRAEPLPPIEPQKAGFSAERLNRIQEFFSREIAQNRVPGAVVGIVRDGNIVYLKAIGHRDKEKGLETQLDSMFGLASMTKPMVAVGVLALTEQGKLPLFSRLATYIPEFGAMEVATKAADGSIQREPQKHPITIQDLLRHTSGLSYGGDPTPAAPSRASIRLVPRCLE
jgi:CubicO group peptidase (beta-lactamase class C family)